MHRIDTSGTELTCASLQPDVLCADFNAGAFQELKCSAQEWERWEDRNIWHLIPARFKGALVRSHQSKQCGSRVISATPTLRVLHVGVDDEPSDGCLRPLLVAEWHDSMLVNSLLTSLPSSLS